MVHFQKGGNIGKMGEIRIRREQCVGMTNFLNNFINLFQGNVLLRFSTSRKHQRTIGFPF